MRYDRRAAIQYAETWALKRNPKYLDFHNLGGDCTNFISQCLYAGLGEMNYTPVYGWYYISGDRRTASWTGVKYLYDFLIKNNREGPRATEVGRGAVIAGDVIQLGRADGTFYHSQLVVSVSRDDLYIATHSRDMWMRPLSSYEYGRIRYLRIG